MFDSFEDCLKGLANDLCISSELLKNYADEDTIGGRNDYWGGMTISENEGKLIYAVTRTLRPEWVVEIGTWSGCSASHILAALKKNEWGWLMSIDIHELREPGIVPELLDRFTFIHGNAETCDWNVPRVDLLLEDSAHTAQTTQRCIERGIDLGAQFIFSHDVNDYGGSEVYKGLDAALPNYSILNLEDSRVGLAYWYKGKKK